MPLEPTAGRVLDDLLKAPLALHPSRTFLTALDREQNLLGRYSYAEIDEKAGRIAAYLQKCGIRRGDAVCVHLPNAPEFLFAWFGVARAGAFMVATNLRSAPDEMHYYLTHSEAKALLSHTAYMDAVEPILKDCPDLKEIALMGERGEIVGRTPLSEVLESSADSFETPAVDPLDTCAVLYTSGTTSRPKGVMITHANYVFAAELQVRTQMLTERDRYLVCLPYFHINAQSYSTLPALAVRGEVLLMERFTKTRFWEIVEEYEPTVASFVPAHTKMLELLEPGPHEKAHRFRLWGGGAVYPRLEERFGVRSIGWFGMTETVGVPVATSPLDRSPPPGVVGWPNVGYRVRIVGEDGAECAPGEVGELEVWGVPGVTLMKGYLKNPQATAETISGDGWLRTGDNVSCDARGYIRYVNRKKDMLKVGGENVAASEIERVVMAHPAVYEAAVIGIPDAVLNEVPKAFVILKPDANATEKEIVAWCTGKLADFKVPREVEFRDEFPRATLEKVSKKTLKEEDRARRKAG